MSTAATIRLAAERDLAFIQSIYALYVRDTPISFELEPPTVDEMGRRMAAFIERFPYLVCERAGQVVGYAYAGPHHVRAAYGWSADVTVYIESGRHRAGIGRALYSSLLHILTLQGFYNACAGITLPNPGSVGLHEAMGFLPVGVYRNVGFKAGMWYDVGWWQRSLREHDDAPAPLLSMEAVKAHPDWQTALEAGLPFLKL